MPKKWNGRPRVGADRRVRDDGATRNGWSRDETLQLAGPLCGLRLIEALPWAAQRSL